MAIWLRFPACNSCCIEDTCLAADILDLWLLKLFHSLSLVFLEPSVRDCVADLPVGSAPPPVTCCLSYDQLWLSVGLLSTAMRLHW